MPQEALAWMLTVLKQLEQAKFTGQVVLSLYQGNLHSKMKQIVEVKK